MDTLYDTVLVGVHVEVIEGRREGDSEGFGSVAGLMVNCSPTHMPSEPCGGTPRGSYTSEPDEQDEFPFPDGYQYRQTRRCRGSPRHQDWRNTGCTVTRNGLKKTQVPM